MKKTQGIAALLEEKGDMALKKILRQTGVKRTSWQKTIKKNIEKKSVSKVKTQRIRELPGKKRLSVAEKSLASMEKKTTSSTSGTHSGQTKRCLDLEHWQAGTKTTEFGKRKRKKRIASRLKWHSAMKERIWGGLASALASTHGWAGGRGLCTCLGRRSD